MVVNRPTPVNLVAQRWGRYPQPLTNEERILQSLERHFPGSEWVVEEVMAPEPTLQMICIGTGPGPKNVLANNGVVYPYGRFKGLKGTPLSKLAVPSSASAGSTSQGSAPPGITGMTRVQRLAYRKTLLENYEELHKYRQKFWAWKKGKRKSQPERPDLGF